MISSYGRSSPYDRLYIYYLEGILAPDPPVLDKRFLGLWVEDQSSFVFFSSPADDIVTQLLSGIQDVTLIDKYDMTFEQWHGDSISPYYAGSFHVCPPWESNAPGLPGTRKLIMDPGVVFGTGRHQTTNDCLSLIERVCTRHRVNRVLDIGTGTGILALAAAAMGCRRVLAMDFNRLAARTALVNTRLNHSQDRVLVCQAAGEQMTAISSDLLIANIHYDIMKKIIHAPGFLSHRWFILSGLLNRETRTILSQLKEMPVHIIERRCPDGIWNTLLVKSLYGMACNSTFTVGCQENKRGHR